MTARRISSPLAFTLLLGACRSGSPITADAGMTGGADAAGGSDGTRVTLQVAAVVGARDARCGESYLLGTPPTQAALLDLRFYVSGLRLVTRDGAEVAVLLDQDTAFQTADVALLDFEDGTGLCSESGNPELSDQITGSVPHGDYVGLAFDLGVPFDLNHVNPLSVAAPLGLPSLFWSWLPGHKFARIDVMPTGDDDAGMPERWNFHLGSTLCTQDVPNADPVNPVAAPDGACGRPNLARYRFDTFDIATNVLELDLARLFEGTDLRTNLGGATPGCQSFPPDRPDCERIFSNLGLDYATGACDDDCNAQTAFQVR